MILAVPLFAGTGGRFDLPTAGGDGVIVADRLCHDLMHDFVFRAGDYIDAHAHWAEGDRILVDLPPTDPHHDHQGRFADARGVIDLPMYPEGTPIARYEPVWSPVADAPPEIVAVADRACTRQHPRDSNEWHGRAGVRRAFKNQYGDYRIVWTAPNPATGGFRWEWVQITAPESVSLYAIGSSPPSPEPPAPESLDGWSRP